MMENEAKLRAGWPGWPSADEWARQGDVGVTSQPYGTALEEEFPPVEDAPALGEGIEAPFGFNPNWDFEARRFAERSANSLLQRCCDKDQLDPAALSQPDSRAVVLGEERKLPYQPGVPLWVLAFRESVSRSRAFTPAAELRALLAGTFYRSFLRAAYLSPERDFAESGDVYCEHLYKSAASHGNGRALDLGDRPDIANFPRDFCGATASAALVEGLKRGGYRLRLGDDWPELVYRKDWNLDVTEYSNGRTPKTPLCDDDNAEPKARSGDIVTLRTGHAKAPATGHYATVLAARMETPDRGFLYVGSGANGPMRTVAIDLVRIEPRKPPPERPGSGGAFLLELNRTSLVVPTRRIAAWTKAGREQLKVEKLPNTETRRT